MRAGGREDGLSVIELMIALMLSSAVLLLASSAMRVTERAEHYSETSSRALGELRVSVERLGKELRQARKVFADSTPRRLHMWIDRDRDGLQECADPATCERVNWELQPAGAVHRLVRYTDASTVHNPVGVDLVGQDAFTYLDAGPAGPSTATIVRIRLIADINQPGVEAQRTIRTEVKLRNANAL